jgi:putative protease
MNDRVELLAPAGCLPSLQAAIDHGADAVYFGLAQLNMRARARRSFGHDDLPEIMERCRAGGVKGYLTLNTILYDHDLPMARRLLEHAAAHQVDAVIMSDMAAIRIARELGLEVHLSTQLSISNFETFRFYAQFGDRIVLARELSLPMIKKISAQIAEHDLRGPSGRMMEIEAFAHGALCIAVSGRCGMSLHTSNASAYRGACEQNCRKEYVVTDKETGQQLEIDNNFVMSPNDLSTIGFLDELLGSGVCVLKIEGRGRAPEYVATVVHAYRQALDAIAAGTYSPEFVQSLHTGLESVYNRGLSSGYYLGREQGWSKSHGSKATHRKVLVGKVTNYYAKIGVIEVQATAGGIEVGEEFVVIGDKTGVINGTVGELRLETDPVQSVAPKETFSLRIDGKARRNDQLFRFVPVEEDAHAPNQA